MGIKCSTTSVAKHVESSNKKFMLYDVNRHEFSNQYEIVTFRDVISRGTRRDFPISFVATKESGDVGTQDNTFYKLLNYGST